MSDKLVQRRYNDERFWALSALAGDVLRDQMQKKGIDNSDLATIVHQSFGVSPITAETFVRNLTKRRLWVRTPSYAPDFIKRVAAVFQAAEIPPNDARVKDIAERVNGLYGVPFNYEVRQTSDADHTSRLQMLPEPDKQLVYQLIQRLYDASQKKPSE